MKRNLSIGVLHAFSFLKSLQFFGAVVVPFYLYKLGFSFTQMFLLETFFSVGMMLLEIPTGVVADRWGRKASLMAGALTMAGAFALFALGRTFPELVAAQLLCALGMTLVSGADRALLYETVRAAGVPEEATAGILARNDACGTAGMVVGFPAGSLIAAHIALPRAAALSLPFLLTAAALVLAALVLLFVRETARGTPVASALKQGVDGFLYIFREKGLRSLALDTALISSATFMIYWLYQPMLMQNAFPLGLQGFVASAFNLSATFLLLLVPLAQRRLGTERTLFLSSLLPGLACLAAAAFRGLAVALPVIFIVTNLRIFRLPLLNALMNERIASENRATVLSGVSMIERVLTSLLYPLVGLLMDRSLSLALLLLGAVTVGLSLFLRAKKSTS